MNGKFSYDTLKDAADKAYKSGDRFAESAQLYTKILEECNLNDQERNKIRGNRCLASQKSGDWKQAIEDAQAALKFNPSHLPTWYRYGISLITAKLPEEATAALETLLKRDPENADAKAKVKKAKQAMRALGGKSGGPLESPEDNMRLKQGVRRSISDAQQELQKRQRTTLAGAPAGVGGAVAMEVDSISPTTPAVSPPSEARSSSCSSDTSANGMAAEDEPIVLSDSPQPIVLDDSSEEGEEEEEPLSAQEQADLHKARGTECFKTHDWQGACTAYGEAIDLTPDNAILYGNRAAAGLMLGMYKAALQDSLTAVKLDPSYARGYHRVGKAYMTIGKFDEAKASYNTALEMDSSDAAAKEGLATLQTITANLEQGAKAIERGDARIALWHADMALRASSPSAEPAQMLKVRALSALGRHSEALAESRQLTVEGVQSHPDALSVRAGTLYCAGNMQLAERVYQEALRMDPDCSSSRRGIKRLRSMNSAKEQGNQAFKLQRWGEAHQHYSQAIEMDPQLQSSFMVQCLCNRSAAAFKLKRHPEALADAERALQFDPDFAKAYLRRAAASSALEDYEGAVRDYEKVKALAPGTPEIGQLLKEAKVELKKSKRVDYYKVLGVEKDATLDEIKKAYKRTALKLHPDKVQEADRANAEEKFKQLTAGHSILSDPEKRRKFDAGWTEEEIEQGGQRGMGGGGFRGGFGGINAEDLPNLFRQAHGGGGFGGGGSHRHYF